jgi:hypothetical protein
MVSSRHLISLTFDLELPMIQKMVLLLPRSLNDTALVSEGKN